MRGLGDLEQDGAGLQVSDLEADKVDVVDILLRLAEVSCRRDGQGALASFSHLCSSIQFSSVFNQSSLLFFPPP